MQSSHRKSFGFSLPTYLERVVSDANKARYYSGTWMQCIAGYIPCPLGKNWYSFVPHPYLTLTVLLPQQPPPFTSLYTYTKLVIIRQIALLKIDISTPNSKLHS